VYGGISNVWRQFRDGNMLMWSVLVPPSVRPGTVRPLPIRFDALGAFLGRWICPSPRSLSRVSIVRVGFFDGLFDSAGEFVRDVLSNRLIDILQRRPASLTGARPKRCERMLATVTPTAAVVIRPSASAFTIVGVLLVGDGLHRLGDGLLVCTAIVVIWPSILIVAAAVIARAVSATH
jgi:hypothetical protein